MYDIEYYFDKNGYSAISDYFADLAKKSIYSKTIRIQKNKIFAYIKALKEYGTRIGNPIVKHIQGDLWELRPLNNRIFFFYAQQLFCEGKAWYIEGDNSEFRGVRWNIKNMDQRIMIL